MLIIAWLSVAPMLDTYDEAEARDLTPHEQKFASAAGFDEAFDVVLGNCSMCHAREPVWEGLRWPPKGVVLETRSDVTQNAERIFLHAGASRAMPPPNAIPTMTEDNRTTLVAWYRGALRGGS